MEVFFSWSSFILPLAKESLLIKFSMSRTKAVMC